MLVTRARNSQLSLRLGAVRTLTKTMAARAGIVAITLACCVAAAVPTADELAVHAPQLAALHRRIESGEATQVADELRSDPHAEIMRPHLCNGTCGERARAGDRAAFPIVGASGMGDSCFNAGMMSIVRCDFAHLFAHFSLTFCSPLPSLFVTAPPRSTWAYTADAYPRVTT